VPRRSIWASGDLGFSILDVEFITLFAISNPESLSFLNKLPGNWRI